MNNLPSGHQIGDYVVVVFPPHALLNCRVEAIRFKKGRVLYDLSVQMKRPDWGKPSFTSIKSVHSAFVCKQGQEAELIGDREPTVSELQAILRKMDYYKLTSGFIGIHTPGAQPDFYEHEPDFYCYAVTREEVLKMIDKS